jgi:HAE1 family hydrophobic/amphiphilic exporter-1
MLPLRLPDGLAALMGWLARSWVLRPAIIVGLVAAALTISYALMPPTSYLPSGNRNLVFARMFTPPDYHLDQQQQIGLRIEDRLQQYWEASGDAEATANLPEVPSEDPFTGEPTTVQPPPLENFFFVAVRDIMFMGGIGDDPNRVRPIEDLMNDAIDDQPGVIGFANQMPLFRIGLRSGDALELEIAGPDLDEVERVAGALYQQYGRRFGFQRIQPSPFNFNLPGTEVRVDPKPVEATDVGLNQDDINAAVQVFGDGAIIGDYLDANDNIDLKVLAKQNGHTNDAAYFAELPVATPAGQIVPLHSVAKIRRTVAPQEINRVEEQRAVTLQIRLPDGTPLEAAMDQVRGDLQAMRADGTIPPTVTANLAGSAAKLTQVKESLLGEWTGFNAQSFLSLANSRMLLALVVVFLLMAALFESWLYPFVIMFSVPLATVGGFLGLFVVTRYIPDQQLDVLTMLGFVILIGIVVNNAILIVHQTLNLIRGEAEVRREGQVVEQLEPKEAIAEAVRTRVRPIFMSMMTSVGGMLPLVLFPGAGSELYRGLGSVVVGGLAASTVFTLVLVPLLLSVMFDLRRRILGAAAKADMTPTAAS